jgi:hypothetical protein
MAEFTEAKLASFTARRSLRRETMEEAHRRVTKGSLGIESLLVANHASAIDDPLAFREYFGEDLPQHVLHALNLELRMLDALTEGIAVFNVSDPTDRDRQSYRSSIRTYLSYYLDLLRAEEAMLASCLITHYTLLVDRLTAASDQVPL